MTNTILNTRLGLQFLVGSCLVCGVLLQAPPLRWADYVGEEAMAYHTDIFFDRLVSVTQQTGRNMYKHMALGVFINKTHVLTSFNPFRQLIKSKKSKGIMRVTYLWQRIVQDFRSLLIRIRHAAFQCARQVIPMNENEMSPSLWHGTDKMHSPVHDLMVVQVKGKINFLDPNPSLYSFDKLPRRGKKTNIAGPMLTTIANPTSEIEGDLVFASSGHVNMEQITAEPSRIALKRYSADDKPVVNCDEWLPREWGYFICIKNPDNFEGISSGAMLFHNHVLYGVGSFALTKDAKSILVFTDVRPYYDQIFMACTKKGQL